MTDPLAFDVAPVSVSAVATLTGILPGPLAVPYPGVDPATYATRIHPRLVLADRTPGGQGHRQPGWLRGWEDHGSWPLPDWAGRNAAVQVARTDLGWLLAATGTYRYQCRYLTFASLGHLVAALAEDPDGQALLSMLEALVAPYLGAEDWPRLRTQLHTRWAACRERDYLAWWLSEPSETPPAAPDGHPDQPTRLGSRGWWRAWADRRQTRRAQRRRDADLQALHAPLPTVEVPALLYAHTGLVPTPIPAYPDYPRHRPLPVTSTGAARLTDDDLDQRAYQRATAELRHWQQAVAPRQRPAPSEPGGLPDGWVHVVEMRHVEGPQWSEDLHLVRSTNGWLLLHRHCTERGPRESLVLTTCTLGELIETRTERTRLDRMFAGPEEGREVLAALRAVIRAYVAALPNPDVEAFLLALGSEDTIPAFLYAHDLPLPPSSSASVTTAGP